MSRGQFAKLYRSILHGTLGPPTPPAGWQVLTVMLMHCGPDGVIDMTPEALSSYSGMKLEDVRKGIAILEREDPESRSPGEGGRRIVRLEPHRSWGWRIVNYLHYRDGDQAEWARTYREKNLEEIRAADRERKRRVRQVSAKVREHVEVEVEVDSPTPPFLAEQPDGCSAPLEGSQDSNGKGPQASPEPELTLETTLGPGEPVLTLPTTRGEFAVLPRMVDEFRALYPAADVLEHLRRMRGWLLSNPRRRKTPRGTPAFINRWLGSVQDRPAPRAEPAKGPAEGEVRDGMVYCLGAWRTPEMAEHLRDRRATPRALDPIAEIAEMTPRTSGGKNG